MRYNINHFRYILFILLFPALSLMGQDTNGYITPMAHEVSLSGNFAELRRTHFHSGLDYRTGGVVNRQVRSIADGYVSRIVVSPVGYGKALYVTHPATGQTSVYAHLNKFIPKIDSVVRAFQYKFQTFSVDVAVDGIEVKQGELIAYSGNTGSSGGPHLHFEIRDTETEDYLDPTVYTMGVTDNVRPKLSTLKVYPQKNEGIVDGVQYDKMYELVTGEGGVVRFAYPAAIKAWGKIGLGIRAFDYTANSRFVFGISTIKLEVDDKEIFSYKNTRFHPNATRYINSFIDYEESRRANITIMKSFVDPGNLIPLYENVVDRGIITIDEERDYRIKYTVGDSFGNKSVFLFTIKGQPMPVVHKECAILLPYNVVNRFETNNVEMNIPKQSLYTDVCFKYSMDSCRSGVYSHYHSLHTEYTPLHNWATIAIKVENKPVDTTSLYAVRYDNKDNEHSYIGEYAGNWYKFRSREFGKYVLKIDTIPPTITLMNFLGRANNPYISFKIDDHMSGIDTYNGYIDGKWVLFEYDYKSREIRYNLHEADIKSGREHEFKLIVTDKVGNENVFKRQFYW